MQSAHAASGSKPVSAASASCATYAAHDAGTSCHAEDWLAALSLRMCRALLEARARIHVPKLKQNADLQRAESLLKHRKTCHAHCCGTRGSRKSVWWVH